MRLMDVLLSQPDFPQESLMTHLPWFEPPLLPPMTSPNIETPRDKRTAGEVADFLKSRFRPSISTGKKAREWRWVTTCLMTEPTEDSAPKYADWDACSWVFVAVDTLPHLDGIRHSGFEGQNYSVARGLLVFVACALHHLCIPPPPHKTHIYTWTFLRTSLKASLSARSANAASPQDSALSLLNRQLQGHRVQLRGYH